MDERVIHNFFTDEEHPVCLSCVLTNAVCDLRDAGAPVARIWEVVKDAIEQWDEER